VDEGAAAGHHARSEETMASDEDDGDADAGAIRPEPMADDSDSPFKLLGRGSVDRPRGVCCALA
jgi:hypothetical protein